VAHSTPTNQKPSIPPIFLPSLSTHPLVSGIQKKSLMGAGGIFLTSGEWEVVRPVRGEAMACREVAVSASRGVDSATRRDATISRGKREGGATRGNTATPPVGTLKGSSASRGSGAM
jgi:hypothetical protein